METPSTCSSDQDRQYDRFYENSDSSSLSQLQYDEISEISDFSIYEQSSLGSYSDEFEDDFSTQLLLYDDTDSSSMFDFSSANSVVTSSSPDSMIKTSYKNEAKKKRIPNGILKRRDDEANNNDASITYATIEKIRESELEDILQYARDIIDPDPTANITLSSQPAKVVQGSFRHLLSVKELHSKTGAFKHRTIEVIRNKGDETNLGINVRKGDGWEKKDGVFVSRVALGSVFDRYEILSVGDQIIQINKIDVKNMNIDDVIRLMHIPEKLSLTVKMLTPFSSKRVAKSDINKFKLQHSKFIAAPSMDNVYKVAQMRIGSQNKNNKDHPRRTILVRNKNALLKEQKTVKISPYRSMEDGTSVPITRNALLSPIRETSSEPRRQSYVTWSDQRSVNSEPV